MKIPVWRFFAHAFVILLGIAVALPSFLPRDIVRSYPAFLPATPVSLGLDLRGGASLTLRADEVALAKDMLADAQVAVADALRENNLGPRFAIEGQTLVIRPRKQDGDAARLRTALETALPTFQRTALGNSEPSFSIADGNDGNLILTLRPAALEAAQADAMEQSVEVVRKRVDEAGVAEPSIQRLGKDRILVQMPGVSDPANLRALLGSTAELTFHRLAADPGLDRPLTGDMLRLPMADGSGNLVIEQRPALHGERLADASAGFDSQTSAPVVQFRFDSEGAVDFGALTQELVGQRFAIVLDGAILSAPVIRGPILGGSGEISGAFTVEETTTLSALLRAGALPVPLEVIEERTVGADLGADAIAGGLWTGLAGFALVAVGHFEKLP